MSEINAPPSLNPANNDSMTGLFRQILDKFLQNIDDMLPARVIAYDRDSNMAQVQPLIQMVTTAGEQINRAQVARIPVFQIGGGNFILNFPIKSGDLGWIKSNDRDISNFVSNYQGAQPNTKRKHSFEDAVFFPHVMTGYTINGEDSDNVVLQNLSGSVRIALWDDQVKITAPKIILDSPTIECTGDITAVGDIIAGPISARTHVHSGVETGSGNTQEPVS